LGEFQVLKLILFFGISAFPEKMTFNPYASLLFSEDQKTIVLYLHVKGIGLDAIHEGLARTLGKEEAAYYIVTKYVQNARFAPKTEAVTPEPPEGRHSPVDEAILAVLGEYPFSSVRELFWFTYLPRSTVHRYLTQSFRFTVRNSQRVPYFLTAEQKEIRVNIADELLRVLVGQVTHQWHDIMTLDESWVYLYTEHEMWASPGETVPDRDRQTIQSPKLVLTVVWNPNGFHVVKLLPKVPVAIKPGWRIPSD
jgi:hypothetical protein